MTEGAATIGSRVAAASKSPLGGGTVALLMFPVGVAQISWQFELRCWEQHGIFIATHSAKAVPTSMEPITRTSNHMTVSLICPPASSILLVTLKIN